MQVTKQGLTYYIARSFVKAFSKKLLKEEIKRAEDVTKNVDGIDPDRLMKALDILSRIDIGVVSSTSLVKSPNQIVQTLGAVKMLKATAEWHYVWTNVFRQRVMLCERHLITALTTKFAALAGDTLDGRETDEPTEAEPTEANWLSRMLDHIRTCLECRLDIRLDSSTYIPNILEGALYHKKANRQLYTEAVPRKQVIEIAVAATRTWFDMANGYVTDARANFVTIVMDHYGPGALLLPHVWQVYIQMPSWTSDVEVHDTRRTKIKFSPEQHKTLRRMVANSEAADHTTNAFLSLHKLKMAYRDLVDRVHYSLAAAVAPSAPKKRKTKVVDDDYDADKEAASGPVPERGDISLAPGRITRLLQEAACATKAPAAKSTPLQKRIAGNTDLLQPLREEGVSRTRINGRNGERLTSDHACTQAGFFSLLVFRNILYNTPYLHSTKLTLSERRVLFSSPADFKKHMKTITTKHCIEDKEAYFCNRKALSSQTITGRTTSTVAKYWKLAQACNWTGLAEQPKAFDDMRRQLEAVANAVNIPGFGKLSRFLTLVDMCAVGIVQKPTEEEMGRCIYRLGAGGKAGLILLGYLDNTGKKPTEDEVVHAFEEYYTAASNTMSAEEQRTIGWDTLVGEHALCKLKRLWKQLS